MTARNVALLVLDTVRKDTFDTYADGVRNRSELSFERAYAPSSWTVPSHASMLTGDLPHVHGIHAHNINYSDLSTEDTFLPSLNRRTIGVSANSFLSPRFGFNELFDEFASLHGNEELLLGGIDSASFMEQTDATGPARYLQYLKTAARESALVPSLVNAVYMKLNNAAIERPIPRIGDYGARTVFRSGLNRATEEEPFFLFMNLVDAHAPHERLREYNTDVPLSWTSREDNVWEVNNRGIDQFPSYLERFRDLYGCSVNYLDKRVLSFVDAVQAQTNGETTVIVTSDHGEELGHTNERTLGHKIPSAAVAHVPLEIINPPSSWISGSVNDIVSLLDIGSLVHGIVDEEYPDLARPVAPVERIGDPHPPEERTAFWNRAIRTAYSENEAYEWDTEGARNRYRVKKSCEHRVEADTTLPNIVIDAYTDDIETAKREALSNEERLAEAVDDRTQDRLEQLGYM